MRPMSWRYKTEKKSCCSETLQCVHGKLAGASSSLIYDHYVDDIRTSTQLFSPMLMWISVCVAGSSKTRCFRILPRRKQNLGTRAQRDEILIASGEPSCFATLSRLTTNSTAPCWRTSTSLNLYHDLDISSFDLKHARSVTRINWRITPPPRPGIIGRRVLSIRLWTYIIHVHLSTSDHWRHSTSPRRSETLWRRGWTTPTHCSTARRPTTRLRMTHNSLAGWCVRFRVLPVPSPRQLHADHLQAGGESLQDANHWNSGSTALLHRWLPTIAHVTVVWETDSLFAVWCKRCLGKPSASALLQSGAHCHITRFVELLSTSGVLFEIT